MLECKNAPQLYYPGEEPQDDAESEEENQNEVENGPTDEDEQPEKPKDMVSDTKKAQLLTRRLLLSLLNSKS